MHICFGHVVDQHQGSGANSMWIAAAEWHADITYRRCDIAYWKNSGVEDVLEFAATPACRPVVGTHPPEHMCLQ